MKQFFYNGGTESYYGCSDPSELVVGKMYEVIAENDRRWQTDYTLKGVTGHFNSVWFIDATDLLQTYFSFSHKSPVKGERLDCFRIVFEGNDLKMEKCCTSTVISVELISKNTYKAITHNSIYIVIVK